MVVRGVPHPLGLQVVVLGRDQHVEAVGRLDPPPVLRGVRRSDHRRLEQGRLAPILDHEVPGLAIRPVRSEGEEQPAPRLPGLRQRRRTGTMQGHRRDLDQEGVPGLALVRAQGREGGDGVGAQGGQDVEQVAVLV